MPKTHLYKLSKAGQEIHIFGTGHSASFGCLPAPVKDFIISHKRLVVESKDMRKPFTVEEFKELDFLREEGEASVLEKLEPSQR